MKKYKCEACESTTIYLSRWGNDHRGTLTCFTCGETEDSKRGISKNGTLVETFKNYHSRIFDEEIDKKYLNDTKRRGPFRNLKNY